LKSANTDPYFREVHSMVDEIASRVPGWSATLEPRRNLFGEPVLKAPGASGAAQWANASINPFTVSAPQDMDKIGQELVSLGKAMPMPSSTAANGRIDLTDRDAYDNGNGKHQSPYDRMLELVGHPTKDSGLPPLREMVRKVMADPEWKGMSPGNIDYPGGTRFRVIAQIVSEYQQYAMMQVGQEYPKLQKALIMENAAEATSFMSDQTQASSILTDLQQKLNVK
jgi:hypothetical protein